MPAELIGSLFAPARKCAERDIPFPVQCLQYIGDQYVLKSVYHVVVLYEEQFILQPQHFQYAVADNAEVRSFGEKFQRIGKSCDIPYIIVSSVRRQRVVKSLALLLRDHYALIGVLSQLVADGLFVKKLTVTVIEYVNYLP